MTLELQAPATTDPVDRVAARREPITSPAISACTTITDPADAAAALADFIRAHAPLLLLTGAGCSTDSGIPDYRDRNGQWKRAEPIRYQRFVGDADARRRYWARSFVGWPRVAAAAPNASHWALAALEALGLVTQLVTQNVDGLHQRGGARRVLDLHGRLDVVDCLDCRLRLTRERVQALLAAHNPAYAQVADGPSAPDGDVLLEAAAHAAFQVPGCPRCGGMLKPAVVFFGENVPRPRVQLALSQLERSRGLLVVGSSLSVFSGYRFCRHAAALRLPIALLNHGRTRADDLAQLKLDAACAPILAATLRRLGGTTHASTAHAAMQATAACRQRPASP
jgi:NAD-dependent SIR2 family protein deacetylase